MNKNSNLIIVVAVTLIAGAAVLAFARNSDLITNETNGTSRRSSYSNSTSSSTPSGILLVYDQELFYSSNSFITYTYQSINANYFVVGANVRLTGITYDNLEVLFSPAYVDGVENYVEVQHTVTLGSTSTQIYFNVHLLQNSQLPSNLTVRIYSQQIAVTPGFDIKVNQEENSGGTLF